MAQTPDDSAGQRTDPTPARDENASVAARGELSVGSEPRQAVGAFKAAARARQAAFRTTLPEAAATPGGDKWDAHGFLLAVGQEDENLYPTLRGAGGARDYFAQRGGQWWRSPRTGDAKGSVGPTRNMTSSQVACVNLFLPWRDEPALLAAMLRVIDPEIASVEPIQFEVRDRTFSSNVELEWTGRMGTLEGRGSRGAHATSADAFLIGATANGQRRAFLIECKYAESYPGGHDQGTGGGGKKRRKAYQSLYASATSAFSGSAPLDDVLYEPFYQIVRLGLLGDMLRADTALELDAARVTVVCPIENRAYRDRITSPALQARFPTATTVEAMARHLWKRPEDFSIIDPAMLVAAVSAASDAPSAREWSAYMQERYGW